MGNPYCEPEDTTDDTPSSQGPGINPGVDDDGDHYCSPVLFSTIDFACAYWVGRGGIYILGENIYSRVRAGSGFQSLLRQIKNGDLPNSGVKDGIQSSYYLLGGVAIEWNASCNESGCSGRFALFDYFYDARDLGNQWEGEQEWLGGTPFYIHGFANLVKW